MFKFNQLEIDANIHKTDISGLEYNLLKSEFEEFWYAQRENKNEVFITKPCPFFPFKDTVLISRGFYDIAHIPSTLNCLFISQNLVDVFSKLKMPKYQVWPIKYSVRKNIYSGYWLAFTYDYARDIDYPNSKFLIKYNKKKNFREETIVFENVEKYIQFLHDQYGMLPTRAEYSSLFNEFYIEKHNLVGVPLSLEDKIHQEFKQFELEKFPNINDFCLDSLQPIVIKFKQHVYELDIIPVFRNFSTNLISEYGLNVFKENKIKNFTYKEGNIIGNCQFL